MSSKCLRIVLVSFTYKLTEAFISFSRMSAQFLENSKNQTHMNIVKFKPLKIGFFPLYKPLFALKIATTVSKPESLTFSLNNKVCLIFLPSVVTVLDVFYI